MSLPKQILRENVFSAVCYSLCLQPGLLFIFMLVINFHPFHPLQWITHTLWNMCTLSTWISMIPLLFVVVCYNISIFTRLMEEKRYYGSRFCRLTLPFLPKLTFLNVHIMLSLSTTWFLIGFLPMDYRHFIMECYDSKCLNGRFMFLCFNGFAAGIYHYAITFASNDPEIEFPIIQQSRLVQLQFWVKVTLRKSLKQTMLPTLCFSLIYAIFNYRFNRLLANSLNINIDETTTSVFSVFTDIGVLFYAWLLTALILSNFQLLFRFYSIAISDQLNLPISGTISADSEQQQELTLWQALGMDKKPVLQKLAALQLHYIANEVQRKPERQEIFALTRLSDHPYNWHHLSAQCLVLMNAFTEELKVALKKVSVVNVPLGNNNMNYIRPLPTEIAQKMLLRQHNESIGIRRMVKEQNISPPISLNKPLLLQETLPKFVEKTVHNVVSKVPCINYLFGESELAHTAHILSHSQHIVWLVKGLSGLCAISIQEDTYGVVQNSLPDVFTALLKLKSELDKLQNINLHGKKLDRHFMGLKNAVKRSIYRMCTAFADYLGDIISNTQELQQLKCYLIYQE